MIDKMLGAVGSSHISAHPAEPLLCPVRLQPIYHGVGALRPEPGSDLGPASLISLEGDSEVIKVPPAFGHLGELYSDQHSAVY